MNERLPQALIWGIFIGLASCSREARPTKAASEYGAPAPAEAKAETDAPLAIAPATGGGPALDSTEPIEPAVPPVARTHPEIEKFYVALDGLRRGQRKSPVRVLWLGDSHTAADFMTHPVRTHLAGLSNDGGPGFVRLGMDGYRHGAVRLSESGKWRKAPILPSQRTRVLDGVFGYGGIRTLPASGASASLEVKQPTGRPFRWTLSYRLPQGASLSVRLGQRVETLSYIAPSPKHVDQDAVALPSATSADEPRVGDIRSTTFEGLSNEAFSVAHVAGDPQVFGAFGEYVDPGLVFDTVGINGARAATMLAWEPEQYVDQLRIRPLDLVVLAFGTNEVFDQTNIARYEEHMVQIVELARAAQPDLPCFIVGPPDSASQTGGSKERVSQVTEAQRQASKTLGCAFTSAYELMGGEGSFSAWTRERPPRARTDRIHLTISGYESLGELLAADLVPPMHETPRQDETREQHEAPRDPSAAPVDGAVTSERQDPPRAP